MIAREVHTNPPPSRRSNPTTTTVLLARRLAQNPELVFDAWLDPAKIQKWIVGASPSDQVSRIAVEPQVGGTFSFLVVRDGRELEHLGGYVEIHRPRRLAFTYGVAVGPTTTGVRPATAGAGPAGTLVTLDFAPAGAGTELRLTHEAVPEEQALQTEESWSKIIQALANSIGH
ncbi:MAG TPA: SRPBCC family protein [Polyangiaceae bacterium]